jgi:hypothetical protein
MTHWHNNYLFPTRLRASPAVSPTRPSVGLFFHPDGENGPVAPPPPLVPRIRQDLGFHPSASPCHPRPGRSLGVRRKQKRGKRRGNFPRAWWPQLMGEKGRSSSSSHRLSRAVKACHRSVFAGRVASTRRVNVVASVLRVPTSIYRRTTASAPHSPRRLRVLIFPNLAASSKN